MKITLSQHTPKKSEGTTVISRKVSILTRIRKIILEDIAKIYPKSDAIHVTIKDTLPKSVLETKAALTGRREKKNTS